MEVRGCFSLYGVWFLVDERIQFRWLHSETFLKGYLQRCEPDKKNQKGMAEDSEVSNSRNLLPSLERKGQWRKTKVSGSSESWNWSMGLPNKWCKHRGPQPFLERWRRSREGIETRTPLPSPSLPSPFSNRLLVLLLFLHFFLAVPGLCCSTWASLVVAGRA